MRYWLHPGICKGWSSLSALMIFSLKCIHNNCCKKFIIYIWLLGITYINIETWKHLNLANIKRLFSSNFTKLATVWKDLELTDVFRIKLSRRNYQKKSNLLLLFEHTFQTSSKIHYRYRLLFAPRNFIFLLTPRILE